MSQITCLRCKQQIDAAAEQCPSCGDRVTSFQRTYSARLIDGKYQILDRLGVGGMGEIFKVRHIHLNELRAMTTEIVQEVRRFSRNLRPIYLDDLGLIPALEMLTRDAHSADGTLATFFNVKGIPRRLKPEREIALYRIVQEGLNNVAAHAQASRADVTVAFSETDAAVTIADNGAGFVIPDRPGELAEAGHYGLLGMRERAELADGWLSIESQPGHGTTIEIHLPV